VNRNEFRQAVDKIEPDQGLEQRLALKMQPKPHPAFAWKTVLAVCMSVVVIFGCTVVFQKITPYFMQAKSAYSTPKATSASTAAKFKEVIKIETQRVIYENTAALINNADLILIGTPINDIEDEQAINNFTLRDIKIEKVIKGNVIGDHMLIGEIATVKNGTTLYIECAHYSVAQKGKHYLFILARGNSPLVDDHFFIMSINQGKFNIDGTDREEIEKCDNLDPQFAALKKEVLEIYAKEIEEYGAK
jgi:hypothetical protein